MTIVYSGDDALLTAQEFIQLFNDTFKRELDHHLDGGTETAGKDGLLERHSSDAADAGRGADHDEHHFRDR